MGAHTVKGSLPAQAKREYRNGLLTGQASEATPKLKKSSRTANLAGLSARSKAAKHMMKGGY